MRVALVVDTLDRGGAERVLVALANRLDRNRTHTTVVETRRRGPLGDELGAWVDRVCLERRRRWDLGAVARFAGLLRERQIEIVHTFNHTSSYFARLARGFGSASWRHLVHDHHGPVVDAPRLRLFDRMLLRHVDAYVGVSARLARYATEAIGLPTGRVEVIENGIELPEAVETSPPERFTVVQVGRLVPEKDHETALRAAAQLKARVPDLEWILVGKSDDTPHVRACRELARTLGLGDALRFAGEQPDAGAFLRRAHVAVLSSRHEGLPISLLEAMAWGLPIVATDAGACRELVLGSGGGLIVPPADPAALAAALETVAGDRPRWASLGRANRAWVARRHGARAMAESFLALYERLLAPARTEVA